MDVYAASPEGTPDGFCHVGVAPREDLRGGLQQGDRRSVVGQHRCELASDGSTADDRYTVGNLGDGQQFVAGDHERAVDLEARDGPRRGAGGQHHMVCGDHNRTLGTVDGHRVVDAEAPRPVVDRHIAPRQQRAESLDKAVDDLLLPHLADGQVHGRLDTTCHHAEPGRITDGPQHRGGLQEFLGRDATHVQAGAAEAALLDEADVEAGGRPVEGRRIAGRTTTDHHDVVPDGHSAITT